ncbi:T9SS type A sorting domain-containing protein [Mesoflavibacter sp. CH_XMU1404-2]|uniref:T9SS type A sorting domain-containing protein n=1 Tax=Mesoflavibacter sp. CH_XMU1404-2 TaxID=3107766 RepID=UPI00300B0211
MKQQLLFFIALITSFATLAQDDPSFFMTPNCEGATATITGTTGGTFIFNPTPADSAAIDAITGEVTGAQSQQTYTVEYTTNGTTPASSTYTFTVLESPIIYQPSPLEICDELDANYYAYNDGFAVFDLTSKNNEITGGASGYTVVYYETMVDAQTEVNPISNPTTYQNIMSGIQTLFVRVFVNSSSCFDITTLTIRVNPNPTSTSPNNIEVCDDDNDGIANFDLTINETIILNGEVGVSASYYIALTDAVNATNAIANPTNFTNTTSLSQSIYVRVENDVTGCFSIVNFDVIVNLSPSPVQDPSNLEVCDDDNDSIAVFNLAQNESVITNGEPGVVVTYHETIMDAQNDINQISDVYNYQNSINPQAIYVRVEKATTGCSVIVDFVLSVVSAPIVNFTGSNEFCTGDSLTLDTNLDSSNYTFEWYYDAVIIASETNETLVVNQAGTYTVEVTDVNNSCTSTQTVIVNEITCVDTDNDGVVDADEDINGNGNLDDDDTDLDTIPDYLDSDDDGDNVSTSVEISIAAGRSNNSNSYVFIDTDNDLIENYLDDDDDGDGVLTINEDYNLNGDPTDDDTNNNGLPDYLDASVALSIDQFNVSEFKIYPNPASTMLNISFNAPNENNYTLTLTDIQGKVVINQLVTLTESYSLDVSNFSKGVYFLKIENENQLNLVKKIIIE